MQSIRGGFFLVETLVSTSITTTVALFSIYREILATVNRVPTIGLQR